MREADHCSTSGLFQDTGSALATLLVMTEHRVCFEAASGDQLHLLLMSPSSPISFSPCPYIVRKTRCQSLPKALEKPRSSPEDDSAWPVTKEARNPRSSAALSVVCSQAPFWGRKYFLHLPQRCPWTQSLPSAHLPGLMGDVPLTARNSILGTARCCQSPPRLHTSSFFGQYLNPDETLRFSTKKTEAKEEFCSVGLSPLLSAPNGTPGFKNNCTEAPLTGLGFPHGVITGPCCFSTCLAFELFL